MRANTLLCLVIIIAAIPMLAKNKSTCVKNERRTKNCFLQLKPYSLKISSEKIILDDSVRHSIIDFPHPKSVEWAEFKVSKVENRILFTTEVWIQESGAADVQSLYWNVYEINPGSLKIVTQHIVQKRRPTQIQGKPGFINDPLTFHEVKKDKKTSKLRWYAGRHSEVF